MTRWHRRYDLLNEDLKWLYDAVKASVQARTNSDGWKSNSNNSSLLQLQGFVLSQLCSSTPTEKKPRFASLLSHNTQKRGEKQSPRKKSRWEYIIWSEKQLVLDIYCLCVKMIPTSSSVSAGSSYWVGGGHYTTWLQILHRPLQRSGSLSDWKPQSWTLGQSEFWLKQGGNNTPGFVMRVYILHWVHACKGGGGTWNLLSINRSVVFIKLKIKQQ